MTPKAINNVTVMVIEDDPDIWIRSSRSCLSISMWETFMNGKTGYENIRKIKPALLISDIQLPEMIARALQFVAMELKAKQQAEEKAQQEKALGQETTLRKMLH